MPTDKISKPKIVPAMPDFEMPLVHTEENAKGPTKAVNAQNDDQNRKSSALHLM